MKFFPLIWAGLRRKPMRTAYTAASIVAAFLLFGVLERVNAVFDQVIAKAHIDRLYVVSRSTAASLPIGSQSRIERVPGVSSVNPFAYFVAYQRNSRHSFGITATDPGKVFAVYPELKVAPEALQSIRNTRTGAIAGRALASRFGWKAGDRILVGSAIPKADRTLHWTLDVVGIFDDPEMGDLSLLTKNLVIRYDFFDQSRLIERGTVSGFVVGIDDARQAASIGAAIDAAFANSPSETATISEKEYADSLIKQIGDLTAFTDAIIGSAFFTLLFLTSNTMMQSVRDRIPEYAVLKTIGFSNSATLMLVVAESVVLCATAAAAGLAGSAAILPQLARFAAIRDALGMLSGSLTNEQQIAVSGIVVGWGLLAALAVAVVSSLIPAWRVTRLEIVDALRR